MICGAKCRFRCSENVDDASRAEIFTAYYRLSADEKDVYLFGCIKGTAPKVIMADAECHRDISAKYFAKVQGNDVVCAVKHLLLCTR
jgi:hypothetical protein